MVKDSQEVETFFNRDHIIGIFRYVFCFVGGYSILDMWLVEMVICTNNTTALKIYILLWKLYKGWTPIWMVKDSEI